jgi:voltage-gated potassium channel
MRDAKKDAKMTLYQQVKLTVYEIVQPSKKDNLANRVFENTILALIVTSIILVVLDTFSNIPHQVRTISTIAESIITVVFTIEYLLRIWTSNLLYPKIKRKTASIRFLFSWPSLVDLLAIIPYYLILFLPLDLTVLRIVRVLRVLRLLKAGRYSSALASVGNVIKKQSHQLISSIAVVFVLMLIASVFIYSVEHDAQPEVFSNAFSGLWWSVATVTTVGYGDIYPVTFLGKMLGSVIALLGIALVAVPTGIISAGFVEFAKGTSEDKDAASEHTDVPDAE